jgi:hypothetical protein
MGNNTFEDGIINMSDGYGIYLEPLVLVGSDYNVFDNVNISGTVNHAVSFYPISPAGNYNNFTDNKLAIIQKQCNAYCIIPFLCYVSKGYSDLSESESGSDLIELLVTPEQIQAALDWLESGQCYGMADHTPVLKTILEALKGN